MKPNKNFSDWLALINLSLGLTIAIFGLFIGKSNVDLPFFGITLNKQTFLITTEIVNLLVLILAFFLIRYKPLVFSDDQIPIFAKNLNISDQNFKKAYFNIDRVNTLVNNIVNNTSYFIFSLIIFYTFSLLGDLKISFEDESLNCFPLTNFVINISNMVSAGFLFLNFIILYRNTLTNTNTPKNYFKGTLLFLLIYIISYFLLLLLLHNLYQTDQMNTVYKLICGLYNGLAMGLLFGRFTSMEFYLKEINVNKGWVSKLIYNYGIVYILPMYVLTQPMFALLEVQNINELHYFKSFVFLICFIGKSFFFIILYKYINLRYLHVYLHLLLANYKIPNKLAEIFIQIGEEKSIGEDQPDVLPEDKNLAIDPYLIDLEGTFTYECVQNGNSHRHGGTCNIELTQNSDDITEWRISGQRKWKQDTGELVTLYDTPNFWNSDKGVIFKDNSYLYSFFITVGEVNYVGVSRGHIKFSADLKTVIEFRGMYFQHKGNEIVWGWETIKRAP